MTIPRRNLDEIVLRYKLEPKLDDIYVEGAIDKKIIDKAFSDQSIHRPVYEIDSVNITDEILDRHGLTRGNKQEVIALCLELGLTKFSNVIFFVDKDMDSHLEREVCSPCLVYTKHCDLEGCFLDEEMIREIVCDAAGVDRKIWSNLHASIEKVVKTVFALRLALEQSEYCAGLPKINKSLSKKEKEIEVDLSNLINRCIGIQDKSDEILKQSLKWFDKIKDLEARNAGRGRDYFDVIEWTIKRFNGNRGIAEGLYSVIMLLVPRRGEYIVAPLCK